MLRHVLVTDNPAVAAAGGRDVVVWVGAGRAPRYLRGDHVLIESSSLRSAAIYVAAQPAELKLDLREPLGFLRELLLVRSLPVLRAA